ncbi:hypothetical protein CIG75_15810 [Tumebacillus algifaecis]|uniref:Prolipoprotein diacylglyceryl transferase n=1 Tax=Tumebacillus algifaecis TaxID=1214604 RepID=A0A223D4B2_9BACL|nr:hypothetical protein [Tumebacillus algifaecis]ASS76263.1 hypothetical protein CIG75_15810 [Tumebacillus algifaecis]
MSILPSGLHLGPIAFDDSGWVGLLLAFIVFLFVTKRMFIRRGGDGEKLTDVLLVMAAVWVLTPRLLSFVYAPVESFSHPILTLVGGQVPFGQWWGTAIALGYGFWQQRKHQFELRVAGDVVARAFVLGFAVYSLCYAVAGAPTNLPWAVTHGEQSYHPLNLYQAAVALGIFALRRSGAWSLLLFGAGMLLLSLLQVHPYTLFGLAMLQWLWLLLALVGLFVLIGLADQKVEKAA